MKTVGVCRALQDAGYFERESQLKEKGAEAMKRLPRINSALTIGVHVGADTDARRVASYNPWMLAAARLVGGAMQANMSVANPYVADITPREERTKRFGMMGAMFGIGFILGPRERSGKLGTGEKAQERRDSGEIGIADRHLPGGALNQSASRGRGLARRGKERRTDHERAGIRDKNAHPSGAEVLDREA